MTWALLTHCARLQHPDESVQHVASLARTTEGRIGCFKRPKSEQVRRQRGGRSDLSACMQDDQALPKIEMLARSFRPSPCRR